MSALLDRLLSGDVRALARSISLVENEAPGYEQLLESLPARKGTRVVGITGPRAPARAHWSTPLFPRCWKGSNV